MMKYLLGDAARGVLKYRIEPFDRPPCAGFFMRVRQAMHWIDRIEAEFNEPIVDVLQGFADMGYGCNTTARMLDYNTVSFRRLLKRKGFTIRWPEASRRVEAYERNPWPGVAAMVASRRRRCPRYTHPETGEALTASQWAARLDISVTQFLRRYKAHGNSRRIYLPNLRKSA